MRYDDDSVYINRILNGDANAFASLVNKHKTLAFNLALRIMKNREDAEEITQDSFVKVYQSLKTFKQESKFSTWLYRIVYNNAISKLRLKKLNISSYDDEAFEWMEPVDTIESIDKLMQHEQKKYINEALNKLPANDAAVLNLFYINDCPVEEITQITGMSQSNVKVKLFRARKRLYEELESVLKTELKEIM